MTTVILKVQICRDHVVRSRTFSCTAAQPGCCWCCSPPVWESGTFLSRVEVQQADHILAGLSGFSPSLLRSICGEKTFSQMSLADAVIAQTTIIRVETQLPLHLVLLSCSSFQKNGPCCIRDLLTTWVLVLEASQQWHKVFRVFPTKGIRQSKVIDAYHGPACSALAGCVVSYCPVERIMMVACYYEDDEWNEGHDSTTLFNMKHDSTEMI